ncbi:MAG: Pesticin receptor [Porticoccaceae bacterium UBA1117]|nr:MAG: Pesticin receptor [Porticoccaceae bacterium UBA1117]
MLSQRNLSINHQSYVLSTAKKLFISSLLLLSTNIAAAELIEEVIVTSDFRDASLLDTAASVTIFDDLTIKNRQAKHLEQLLNLAPNVNFSSGASRGRFIQIRGIGERSQFIEPLNPSVGILVDGIDFTGIAGAATTMDIKQVEILRGPQGTLYGANALAGLINLTSNQPSEITQGSVSLGAGSHGTKSVSGALGGSLNNAMNYRVAAQSHTSDGYITNDFLKRDDTDNIDELSLRGIIDWRASDDLSLKLTLFKVDADNGYDAFSLDNTRNTLSDKPGHDRQESTAFAVQSNWQANEQFDVVSLISFADSDLEYGYDEDWAFPAICAGQECDGWEYNSEDNYLRDRDNSTLDVKLVSKQSVNFLGKNAHWVLGVYAREQDEQLLRQYTYNAGDFSSSFDTENRAIYGQLDTDITSNVSLVTGLRLEGRKATYTDSDGVAHSVDENLWGGRIALQYKPNDSTMLYGLVSRGYKAGGVNSDPSLSAEDREFDTELMLNFETGVKGSWFEQRLQTRLSVFYQQRKDIQIKQSLVQSRDDSNASDFTDYFGNSGKGRNYGMEAEVNWLATEALSIQGSLGLLETEYDTPLSTTLDSRDQAHAPRYQFALGSSLRISENLSWTADIEGKDKFYLSSSHNEQSESYWLLNTNLAYSADQWTLSVWGRNLTNEDVIVRGFGGFGNDPRKYYATEPYYQFGEPRVFGVSGQYNF